MPIIKQRGKSMTFDELREFAAALNIQSVGKFKEKKDLIRTIQLAEGNVDCFLKIPNCQNKKCAWFEDCIIDPTSTD
jgi:hypothetical protein